MHMANTNKITRTLNIFSLEHMEAVKVTEDCRTSNGLCTLDMNFKLLCQDVLSGLRAFDLRSIVQDRVEEIIMEAIKLYWPDYTGKEIQKEPKYSSVFYNRDGWASCLYVRIEFLPQAQESNKTVLAATKVQMVAVEALEDMTMQLSL